MLAARHGHSGVVKQLLLADGISLGAFEDDEGCMPLQWAVRHENTEIVRLLLMDKRVDVDSVGSCSVPSLHFAAKRGNSDILNMLLAAGANVDSVDNDGQTTLLMAGRDPETVADFAKRHREVLGGSMVVDNVEYSVSDVAQVYRLGYLSVVFAN